MIVRDGADTLAACLRSVASLADEIVVVDTGSVDDSPAIARRFGARVVHVKWQADFSAARNAYVDAARCSWILSLDADEVLEPVERESLDALLRAHPGSAFGFTVRNYFYLCDLPEVVLPSEFGGQVAPGIGFAVSRTVRMFPRRRGMRYSYPVHESLLPAMAREGVPIAQCPIPIHHTGPLQRRERVQSKAAFYRELGLRKVTEQPDYFLGFLELGKVYLHGGYLEDAERMFAQCIRLNPSCAAAYYCLALSLFRRGQRAQCWNVMRHALMRMPANGDLLHLRGALESAVAAGRSGELSDLLGGGRAHDR